MRPLPVAARGLVRSGRGSHSPAPTTREPLEQLLRDFGPSIRRGTGIATPAAARATGLDTVDRLLRGGFPRGHLSEISGPVSAGRTSLALVLLERTTRSGELAAVIDPSDSFDPASAARAGVTLERVLWARPPGGRRALQCTERLLQTEGFPLVVLDLVGHDRAIEPAAWLRLARLAAGNRSTLLILSQQRLSGPQAAVSLDLRIARAHFTGRPPLFEGIESTAVVLRHRSAPTEGQARVRFTGSSIE